MQTRDELGMVLGRERASESLLSRDVRDDGCLRLGEGSVVREEGVAERGEPFARGRRNREDVGDGFEKVGSRTAALAAVVSGL